MAGKPSEYWSVIRVDRLRSLWAEDFTASEIAKDLGDGVTRNAVLGKVHRLRLAARTPRQNESANEARRLGLARRQLPPSQRVKAEPNSVTIGNGRSGIAIVAKAAPVFKAPKLVDGGSRTSPAWRNQLGMAPVMSVNQRRNFLAEAVRNTAALQSAEAGT